MKNGLITLLLCFFTQLSAHTNQSLNIAVASNFIDPFREIATQFEQQSGIKIHILAGSTGKHYAQIINGAPIDIFFAADSKYPAQLTQSRPDIGKPFTYAIGQLVLWQPSNQQDKSFEEALQTLTAHISIANPRHAPYGQAAKEVLTNTARWKHYQPQLVYGEHVGQAFQFIITGGAQSGFVAKSQLVNFEKKVTGLNQFSYWEVPKQYYSPIKQDAVLVKQSKTAEDFLQFFQTAKIQQIIKHYGYLTDG